MQEGGSGNSKHNKLKKLTCRDIIIKLMKLKTHTKILTAAQDSLHMEILTQMTIFDIRNHDSQKEVKQYF